jgi:LuxR family maltose regulon positive regulatory protein
MNRPRLVDRFQAGLSGTLTLISAPAGSGETTLLSEWRAGPGSKTPVAWISLDTGDNDPLRFFQYLLAAPDTLQPGIVQEIHPFLQTSEKLNYEAILILLVNALGSFTQDFTLVLDDYHVIQTLAIHEALTFILDNLPPRMHLVLLTRTDPSLPLARLCAHGQLKRLLCSFLLIIRSCLIPSKYKF